MAGDWLEPEHDLARASGLTQPAVLTLVCVREAKSATVRSEVSARAATVASASRLVPVGVAVAGAIAIVALLPILPR